jgi:hypothetical protein
MSTEQQAMQQDTSEVITSPPSLEQLTATIAELSEIVSNLRGEIQSLNSKVEFLHNGMQALDLKTKHQSETIQALGGLKKFSHLSPPEPYDGSPDKAKSFLNSLREYFRAKAAEFADDDAKVTFAGSYMKLDKAKRWIDNLLDDDEKTLSDVFPTWDSFLTAFKNEFHDPLAATTAKHKLKSLKQGTGTVQEYITAFETYSRQSGYDDQILMEHFETGLTAELQQRMYTLQKMPTTLKGWKLEARKLDEQDQVLKAKQSSQSSFEQKKSANAFNNSNFSVAKPNPFKPKPNPFQKPSTTPQTKTASGTIFGGSGQPMDLDAAKRAGLCYGCGTKGHMIADCPKKPPIQIRQVDVSSYSKEQMEALLKQWQDVHPGEQVF